MHLQPSLNNGSRRLGLEVQSVPLTDDLLTDYSLEHSQSSPDMEVDVEDSPIQSPIKAHSKENGVVVEVAGPVVIQYKDKKNREKDRAMKNDCYCWICHHTGNMLCCEKCPRVFHLKCIPLTEEPDEDWICPCCSHIIECAKLGKKAKCCRDSNLDEMLPYAIERMKSTGTEAFQQPVTVDVAPGYFDFVHNPMDIQTLGVKVKAGGFLCTEHFLNEARWILHNCIIFNGGKSRLTALARTVYNVCHHEMVEINLCPDCFLNSCLAGKDWFTLPCRKTHRLVWAKLRGFPFWPAKVLQRSGQQIDVRFFGEHNRAWIHESNTMDISEEPPVAHRNKSDATSREASDEEMNKYIENLKKMGRWPIDVSKLQEDKPTEHNIEDDKGPADPPKKKKKEMKKEVISSSSKAPKLKISSNSMMARDDNPFKFDDSEFKGTHKPETSSIQRENKDPKKFLAGPLLGPPNHAHGGGKRGKRRMSDDKVKLEVEPERERVKLKQKLSLKSKTNHVTASSSSSSMLQSPSTIVDRVFSASSTECGAWKYTNKLMDAISSMVEDMFEETRAKYKCDSERAVELATMAANLEKEQFKLDYRKNMDKDSSSSSSSSGKCKGDKCKGNRSSADDGRHEEELRNALEEQRLELAAEKERCVEEVRLRLEQEKEEAVAETKKHQWCAACSQAAMYHCCWNTSYCGYNCQTSHWPQHMYKCEQQNRAAQQGAGEGMVLARQAPNQLTSPSMPPEMNSRPD